MPARAPAYALIGALLCATLACAHLPGRTRGPVDARVVGRIAPPSGSELGPAAVFLERVDLAPPTEALAAVVVGQSAAGFEPGFTVTAVGQPVLFVNRDRIFQAAFSYSTPNAFECRPFAPGEICLVTFGRPGVVRIYSPLHSDARAVVFVVPGPHYAVPGVDGRFRIEGVAAGRYRASVWTEQHGLASREISIAAGETARVPFALDGP